MLKSLWFIFDIMQLGLIFKWLEKWNWMDLAWRMSDTLTLWVYEFSLIKKILFMITWKFACAWSFHFQLRIKLTLRPRINFCAKYSKYWNTFYHSNYRVFFVDSSTLLEDKQDSRFGGIDKCKILVIFIVHFRTLVLKKSKNPSKHEFSLLCKIYMFWS
jgi:hypothetical protein